MRQSIPIFGVLIAMSIALTACDMGRNGGPMSDAQRQQLETGYDSLQTQYKMLMADYNQRPESLPDTIQQLYTDMQQMHRQMETNHRQMMSQHMGGGMKGPGMMGNRKQMRMQMQDNMTGEWYQQMMAMHQQMARMHNQRGQQHMARMNRRMSETYRKMSGSAPRAQPSDSALFNKQGDPSVLNGRQLFTSNCASCHGSDGTGISGAFPPVVNTRWVDAEPSVPVRILMNGLSGDIDVQGRTYNGVMPSFRARLSAAEIAAILNYLRSQSNEELPEITQEEVISVGNTYSDRNQSWSASELQSAMK